MRFGQRRRFPSRWRDACAHAASVSWTGQDLAGKGVSTISTNGTLVYADNWGTTNTIAAGGVSFTGRLASDARLSGPSRFDFVGYNPPNVTGENFLDSVINTGVYSSVLNAEINATWDNLTIGRAYELQVFVVDGRSPFNANRKATVIFGDPFVYR